MIVCLHMAWCVTREKQWERRCGSRRRLKMHRTGGKKAKERRKLAFWTINNHHVVKIKKKGGNKSISSILSGRKFDKENNK